MNLFFSFVTAVFRPSLMDADQRFLSQAADGSDLERRMRQLEHCTPFKPYFGLNA